MVILYVYLYYFAHGFFIIQLKKILRQADKVGDNIQHVRVQRKRWYDDALFQDESIPPDDAPAWTISSSYNRDSHTRGGGSGSGRQNEQEGGGGSGSGRQNEGGSGSGRSQRESGSGSGRQDERDVGSGSGSGQRESGGGGLIINQNEEERGGGSGGNRRLLLVEESGQTEEPRRDKGKGTGVSSISNILNP